MSNFNDPTSSVFTVQHTEDNLVTKRAWFNRSVLSKFLALFRTRAYSSGWKW